jgi:hypothetical protein
MAYKFVSMARDKPGGALVLKRGRGFSRLGDD